MHGSDHKRRTPATAIRRAGFAARVAMAIGALALAVASAAAPDASRPKGVAAATTAIGSVSIGNSREGSAIVSAAGLEPGGSASGTVTIRNTGAAAARFSLSKSNVIDRPGPFGGALSGKLILVVEDVTGATPVVLHVGQLAAIPELALGSPFEPNENRTYRFTASFPDGGQPASVTSGDNAYKGSSASVEFDWSASSDDAEPAADTTAPIVTLRGRRVQRLRRTRPLRVTVSCNEACRVSATAALSGRPALRRIKLTGRSRALAPAKEAALAIRLPMKAFRMARAALRRGERATLIVTVVASDDSGNARTEVRRLRLEG
jgi:hypothetical protein